MPKALVGLTSGGQVGKILFDSSNSPLRDESVSGRRRKGLQVEARENLSASLMRERCLSDFVFAERK